MKRLRRIRQQIGRAVRREKDDASFRELAALVAGLEDALAASYRKKHAHILVNPIHRQA
jgi:hypothetical protein